ncbi:MAG: hypothetical protein ACRD6N_05685 [Pyrinomonadaceae bacterium]
MFSLRLTLFSVVVLMCCCGASLAQRPGPEFWRRLTCEPFEPRTKLEAFETKYGTVVFKGFTRITTVEVRDVRIDALEMRYLGNSNRATGVVVSLREPGERPRENRAFVDYEEIDALIKGIDAVSLANESMTKLAGFEARYRTLGDLEIEVFRQTRSGTAVTLSVGICDRVNLALTLDELGKIRAMIVEAKAKLDESK